MKPVIQALGPVLIGLLVFVVLRGCWMDRYVVSSGSMEPLLHGHPESGDRVLVDKSAATGWTPERGDLVVVRSRENDDAYLIKRVIALGGERVSLMSGDVFLWNPGRGDWERWEKDPLRSRDMRMSFFEHPGAGEVPRLDFLRGAEVAGDGILLPAAAEHLQSLRSLLVARAGEERLAPRPSDDRLVGHLSTSAAVDARFLDSQGRLRGGAAAYQDVGMEIDVWPREGLVGLQLVLEFRGVYYGWSYERDGQVQFHIGGQALGDPVEAGPLSAGQTSSIEVGYLDGRFFMIDGDRLCGIWRVDLPPFGEQVFGFSEQPDNLLHIAAAGAPALVSRLRVFHDVYYAALPRPFRKDEDVDVPLGELWLLGDNTFDSRDSRSLGGFPQSDLIGKPVAILGPLERFRMLGR